ncbi:hypothetical protein RR46_07358 [Papilio xuthus]|uniref:Uncharacterized protein n=1 Tax=Papilio xuthus TaxID=66420 RepID=A0A194PW56_PAPXU|nr:hypothetical protein RR46_07358 [Papilio xuthus]
MPQPDLSESGIFGKHLCAGEVIRRLTYCGKWSDAVRGGSHTVENKGEDPLGMPSSGQTQTDNSDLRPQEAMLQWVRRRLQLPDDNDVRS